MILLPSIVVFELLPTTSLPVTLTSPSSVICLPWIVTVPLEGVTISIFSLPVVSVRRMMLPPRVLITFTSLLPSLLPAGGLLLRLQTPPITTGSAGAPLTKTTSTCSFFSGRNCRPRSLPAPRAPIRAA